MKQLAKDYEKVHKQSRKQRLVHDMWLGQVEAVVCGMMVDQSIEWAALWEVMMVLAD